MRVELSPAALSAKLLIRPSPADVAPFPAEWAAEFWTGMKSVRLFGFDRTVSVTVLFSALEGSAADWVQYIFRY